MAMVNRFVNPEIPSLVTPKELNTLAQGPDRTAI